MVSVLIISVDMTMQSLSLHLIQCYVQYDDIIIQLFTLFSYYEFGTLRSAGRQTIIGVQQS